MFPAWRVSCTSDNVTTTEVFTGRGEANYWLQRKYEENDVLVTSIEAVQMQVVS